nr:defective RNA dependent RNA polymerase [Rosellinia necatrix partitivirus 6]
MSSVFNNVRNYLQERLQHVKREWQIYQATGASSSNMTEERIQQLQDLDTRRMFHTARNAFDTTTNTPGPVSRITEEQRRLIYDAESDKIMNALRQHDEMRSQPFELFMTRPDSDPIPPNRIAAPGIWQSPLQFHTGQIVHADPSTTSVLHPDEHEDYAESYLPGDTDQGYEIDPTIYELLTRKYPEYLPYAQQYCRPKGTTDGTFRDFNKEQKPCPPLDSDRKEHVLKHVFKRLAIDPYLPLHFVDTQYCKLPLVTGTGYHNRYSYRQKAHASFSHPLQYGSRPTSTTYPDLNEDNMYDRMDKLLKWLHLWYNNMTFVTADGYAYRRMYAGVPSGLFNTQFLDSFANLYILIDGMIEFGFTDEEIDSFLLFVLGDDNSGMTNLSLARLHEFIQFLEAYALTRYHMVLSHTKSVITALRNKIESLGYQCNFGLPKRDIGKLVAQLIYPEHKIKYHTMSARAIGLAYASCAYDKTFYNFCKSIYNIFLDYYEYDEKTALNLSRFLTTGQDDLTTQFSWKILPPFPTREEIRKQISFYHGPLDYAPKWNFAHFINKPDVIPPSSKTMYDYEIEHSLRPQPAPTFVAR